MTVVVSSKPLGVLFGEGVFGTMVLIFENGDVVVVMTEPTSFRPLNDMMKTMDLKELIDNHIE